MGNWLLDQINKNYFWHLKQVLTWDRTDGAGPSSSALSEWLCDPGGGGETTQTQMTWFQVYFPGIRNRVSQINSKDSWPRGASS